MHQQQRPAWKPWHKITLGVVGGVLALVLVVVLTSGDDQVLEGDLDASGQTACDETARYAADGFPEEGRDEALSVIYEAATESEIAEISEGGDLLGNTLAGSPTAWQHPLDVIAAACRDHGWEGANGK